MNFCMERTLNGDMTDEIISFRGEVRISEIEQLQLDPLDRALLDDVGRGTEVTASDYLLALEMIFRRLSEQMPSAK